MGIGVGAW